MARGILFKSKMIDRIVSKRKTETRRMTARALPKVGEVCYLKSGYMEAARDADRWVLVTKVYEQRLRDMTDEDARRDGFGSVTTFTHYFQKLHGGDVSPDQVLHVVRFELMGREVVLGHFRNAETGNDPDLAQALEDRWSDALGVS